MARAARPLAALLLATSIALVTATPCAACSCVQASTSSLLEDADAAFVGEVVTQRAVTGGTIQVLRVDGVYEGDLGPQVALFARLGQGVVDTCAVLLPTETRIGVIATRNADGTYSTGLCAITTVRALRMAGGRPRPPDPSIALVPPAGGGPPEAAAPRSSGAVVLAGALLVAGLVAMASVRERTRRRSQGDATEAGREAPR
jgi:hypothetical protein